MQAALKAFGGLVRRLGAVAAMALLLVPSALAADKITLKDGSVVEGTIIREESGYVWIRTTNTGVAAEKMLTPSEIRTIERESVGDKKDATKTDANGEAAADPKPEASAPAGGDAAKKDAPKSRSGAPRAAVITLGGGGSQDMVGLYITAETLRRMIPMLKEEQVEIVVFRINSGGGALSEIEPLGNILINEYKSQFTVAAWIESAISAAAMTSHHLEDIYFMSKGNYGAATAWYGNLQAVKGLQLERILAMMERVSAKGGHDKTIARAMQIEEPLYAEIDETTGQVRWSNSDKLQYEVNPRGRIFTFNAETAAKFKFSRGTADDVETLGKLMGYSEVVWVGEKVPGVPYPVSKAEAFNRKFRERTAEDERRTREYQTIYMQSLQMAQGAQGDQRGAFIGRARQQLENIKRMVNNNPNFAMFVFGAESYQEWKDRWLPERDEELRRLSRPR
jgi:hypothetical protein